MSTADKNKPAGKPGKRNRKAEQRNHEADRQISSMPNEQQDAEEQIGAAAEPGHVGSNGAAAQPADVVSIAAAAFEGVPISVQTIATAYGDYTRKSFEQTRSFVDKLTRVRSLDKALEVQIEFARQAYETFVGEMQKICGLHNALAKQSLKPLQRFMTNTMRGAR